MGSDYIELAGVLDELKLIRLEQIETNKKLDSLFHDVPNYPQSLDKRETDLKPISLFRSSRSIRHTLEQRALRIKKDNPSGMAS